MNCWVAGSITDSFGSELAPLHDGLALIAASSCPHYDGEPQRRPAYRVERRDREAHEERLEARYLGG
jgi:hypothetical protein